MGHPQMLSHDCQGSPGPVPCVGGAGAAGQHCDEDAFTCTVTAMSPPCQAGGDTEAREVN